MLLALTGAALLALGFALGWRLAPRTKIAAAPPPEEQEVKTLQEDRAAFAQLMGYNARRAYGGED